MVFFNTSFECQIPEANGHTQIQCVPDLWMHFHHWFACLESWKIHCYHNSIETSARRGNNSQDKPPIRDWQGASSLFSSCYWDPLGPSSTESSTELLGPSSSEWQVWKGTTTWGASVIADLGQVMAAACGTPALGPWIDQSTIKLWFRAFHHMFESCTVTVYFMFIPSSDLPKSMLCQFQFNRNLICNTALTSALCL